MYDDFYGYEEVKIYVYQCSICKKIVKEPVIHECLVCKNPICKKTGCNMGGFCVNHYDILSWEGKIKFNQLMKEEKSDFKISNYGCYCSMAILGFIYLILMFSAFSTVRIERYEYVFDSNIMYTSILAAFGLIPVAVIVFIVYYFIISQRAKHYDREKLDIYSKYNKYNVE